MTTSGGGWTLVLNYLHQGDGQTNVDSSPALNTRTADLPLLGSNTLGTNEANNVVFRYVRKLLTVMSPPAAVRLTPLSAEN